MLKPPPQPKQEIDLLSDFDAPARVDDPPPFYDTNFLPPPPPMEALPPAFDDTFQFVPPPPLNSSLPPPPPIDSFYDVPPPAFMPPPEASAPSFEDLLGNQQHYGETHNLLGMPTPVPPPPEIDEDILAALDPSERQAILEEQRKIMEQIEKERSNDTAGTAAARALAFDQRSSAAVAKVAGLYDSTPSTRSSQTSTSKPVASSPPSYTAAVTPGMVDLGSGEQVPLHGQEKTQKAIQDGTALIVQCLNCQNWMQVTKDATLMFCPTCQVVSPVLAEEAATSKDMEKAAQLAADAQLAEKLQAEEYGQTEASSSGASRNDLRSNNQKRIAKLEKGQAVEKSWYDWFLGSSTTTTTTTAPAKPTPDRGSAEIRRGLVAASTGEESYGRGSYDESERLVGSGARVAESKGMFACVADAVGSAVYSMNQDEEGNVHGVDASGLLAMPNVSRQRD